MAYSVHYFDLNTLFFFLQNNIMQSKKHFNFVYVSQKYAISDFLYI